MIKVSIIVMLCIWICGASTSYMHTALLNRPIFIGFITGLMLGDIQMGILIGAQLELAFMGIVVIGANAAANPGIATVMTVALGIYHGIPMESAIPVGMTIGYAASQLDSLGYIIDEVFLNSMDAALKEDKEGRFKLIVFLGSFLTRCLIPSIIAVIGVAVGGEALASWINSLPAFILTGIMAAAKILPAFGIATILSMILTTDRIIYFMLGFVIYQFLGVDMIFMLVVGLVIALTDFYFNNKINKIVVASAKTDNTDEMEDFLS